MSITSKKKFSENILLQKRQGFIVFYFPCTLIAFFVSKNTGSQWMYKGQAQNTSFTYKKEIQ